MASALGLAGAQAAAMLANAAPYATLAAIAAAVVAAPLYALVRVARFVAANAARPSRWDVVAAAGVAAGAGAVVLAALAAFGGFVLAVVALAGAWRGALDEAQIYTVAGAFALAYAMQRAGRALVRRVAAGDATAAMKRD